MNNQPNWKPYLTSHRNNASNSNYYRQSQAHSSSNSSFLRSESNNRSFYSPNNIDVEDDHDEEEGDDNEDEDEVDPAERSYFSPHNATYSSTRQDGRPHTRPQLYDPNRLYPPTTRLNTHHRSERRRRKEKPRMLTNVTVLVRPSSAPKESVPARRPAPPTRAPEAPQYVFEELSLDEQIDYVPGTLAVQVMDKFGKLKTTDLKKLLKDHPSSLVIGVFGRPGLGKSFLLSQFSEPEDVPPFPLSDPSKPPKPFAVYAHVTSQRLILLDTQLYVPTGGKHLSPTAVLRRSKPVPNTEPSTVFLETLNVQLCAWLLSVTDLCFVLLPQDTIPKDLLECLRKAKEIVQRMPFLPHAATPVFLRNRTPPTDFRPPTYQAFLHALPPADPAADLLHLHAFLPSLPAHPPRNTFWLPDLAVDPGAYPFTFHAGMDYVHCKSLLAKKKKPCSEIDWIKLAVQAWDFLKRSEYMLKAH